MLNLNELANELQEITAWQETPVILGPDDYLHVVIRALRTFFRDINRPAEYSPSLFIETEDMVSVLKTS